MIDQLLATKLYIPPVRVHRVSRPRLLQRLDEGLSQGARLTLVSASAGFGKTTLVSEWVAACGRPAAWLSLDAGDNDPARFLAHLVAALRPLALSKVEGIFAGVGAGVLAALESPHQPPCRRRPPHCPLRRQAHTQLTEERQRRQANQRPVKHRSG